jgi:hypothetical protein
MLMAVPFANALALTVGIFYIIAWIVAVVLPDAFKVIFDSQFFGAKVSSLYKIPEFGRGIGTLVILLISAWIVGYVFVYLYLSMLGM